LDERTYILREPKVAARRVGTEMVILGLQDSTLFTLNEIAGVIWESADGSRSLDQIVAKIVNEFEVEREVAYADAVAFINAMASHSMIHLADHPSTTERR
jgi:hypothetical protein